MHRLVWGEPRSAKLKPTLRATFIFLALLLGYFVIVGLVSWARQTDTALGIAAVTAGLIVYAGIWLLVARLLPHRDAPWAALVPGSLLLAVGLVVLQAVTLYILAPYILNKGGTYVALGIAAGLLFSLYLISRLMVASAVLNAALWERGAVLGKIGTGRRENGAQSADL